MNLLITSAGRRGYMVQYFKNAVGQAGKVYAGNSDIFAPAFCYADTYVITPPIYNKEYIPFLLNYCEKEQITMIISLFDIDLPVLSANKELFKKHGISVIVSNEQVIHICNDKWETYQFCKKNGIPTAKTFLKLSDVDYAIDLGVINFPLIIKPRWGMGTLSVYQVDNKEEMNVLFQKCKKDVLKSYLKFESKSDIENCVIIQEKLKGQEYGLDIINDLDGNFCSNVVRKKYAMRAGETDCTVIEKNAQMDKFARNVSINLKHIGILDMDAFLVDEQIYLLEMNARFGGGYPFSHLAGLDVPKAIVKWIEGKNVKQELIVKNYGQILHKDISFVNISDYIGGNENGSK